MNSDAPVGRTERACRLLIGLAARLVPAVRRAGWKEEWEAEVWHHLRGRDPGRGTLRPVLRCLGAFPHALWVHGEEWNVESVGQDVRYGVRTLLRRPLFTTVAVATLALGIGGSTAVFSVVESVLLRPLPMENAERIVWVWGRRFPDGPGASVSPPDFLDYRDGTGDVFEVLGAMGSFTVRAVLEEGPAPREVAGRSITADFLRVLGHEPAAGRSFTEDEVASEAPGVVMISYGLWGRLFGRDPDAVGRTVHLDGEAYTVVGVFPRELGGPSQPDVWYPLTFGSEDYRLRAAHFLRPHGLLRPGVDLEEAQAAMDRVSARLEAAHPETNDGWYAQLQPLRETLVGSARPALLVLLAGIGLVLLIACANVANLLLSRASARRGEMAVRSALGASRLRLTRQVLTESVVLAAAAGAVGVGLAYGAVAALRRLDPGNLPRMEEVGVNGTALAVTAVVTVLVGLLFGAAPAAAARRVDLAGRPRGAGRGRSARRTRDLLVAGEVAISLVLLVGAGLLGRSFLRLRSVDPGFRVDGVVALPVSFPERTWPDPEAVEAAWDEVRARLATVRGVESVGAASALPLSGSMGDTYVYAEGHPPTNARDVANTAQIRVVDPGYFETLEIPLVAGRAFDASDDPDAPRRVILNQRLARELFPDESAVGRRMVAWLDEDRSLDVVGVVADVRQFGLAVPPAREFYLPARQVGARSLEVVVRSREGTAPAAALREAVREVDPGQPVGRVTPLERYLDGALARGRFQAVLLAAFAALALALAGVGIYGVLAQAVGEQRREIGVRMALGAGRAGVTGMVVRRGLSVAAAGMAAGLVGAWAASRALRSMLFEVSAGDPLTWVGTPAFLAGVVLLSSWLPARRASRTDPAAVLREQT